MSDHDANSRLPPAHEIIVVPLPGHEGRQDLLDQCVNVRIDVFVHEQEFPLDVEVDQYVIPFIAPLIILAQLYVPATDLHFTIIGMIRRQLISCFGLYPP